MGIIEKLELHQFMCHKYLEFTFGPQINFIIGKSAHLRRLIHTYSHYIGHNGSMCASYAKSADLLTGTARWEERCTFCFDRSSRRQGQCDGTRFWPEVLYSRGSSVSIYAKGLI